MNDIGRFEKFIRVIADGTEEWEYEDGTLMQADAAAFLNLYETLQDYRVDSVREVISADRLRADAAESEAAALRTRVAELEATHQFRPATEPPSEAGEYAVLIDGRTCAARYDPEWLDDWDWPWSDFDGTFTPVDGWRPL